MELVRFQLVIFLFISEMSDLEMNINQEPELFHDS